MRLIKLYTFTFLSKTKMILTGPCSSSSSSGYTTYFFTFNFYTRPKAIFWFFLHSFRQNFHKRQLLLYAGDGYESWTTHVKWSQRADSKRKTSNGGKSNKCNRLCDFASSWKGGVRNHLKSHMGEKLNKCYLCDFASSRASNLRRHLKTHSGEKPNKCNLCDYASSQKSHLRTHLKTHGGEKTFKCNLCDYASTEAGKLRKHFKTHGGEKTNKCNLCDYASYQAGDLKRHRGENSNKCNQCEYASSSKSNLNKHVIIHIE